MQWPKILKFARKVSGLSLRDVAKKTGLSNPYISQLENGHIEEPSFFKIVKLLKLYNLDAGDLE